jgi:flagellar hook-associated protein 1 FlgK
MSGITSILDIARGALFTQKNALEVTGHNIANVNTPGYSVQRSVLESNTPVPMPYGVIGSGVKTAEIRRTYSQFLNDQLNEKKSILSRWEAQKDILGLLETEFNESGGSGINQLLSDFWNGWEEVANNPEGQAERTALVAKATTLSEAVNTRARRLRTAKEDLDTYIRAAVAEVNRYAEQLADLNEKIASVETQNVHANDFRDQRDQILEQLAEVIPVRYLETRQKTLSVFLPGGYALVEGTRAWRLDAELDEENILRLKWDGATDMTGKLAEGKLGGWLELRDSIIPKYEETLDALAAHLANGVNELHRQGYDAGGEAGTDFFTYQPSFTIVAASDNTGSITFEQPDPRFYDPTTAAYAYEPGRVTGDCYDLSFGGGSPATDLVITNRSTGAVVSPEEIIDNGDGTCTYTFDGMRLTIGGTAQQGDSFVFRANRNVAANLSVAPTITADPGRIAAGRQAAAPGDNTNALAIANLRHEQVEVVSLNGTLSEIYDVGLVAEVGTDAGNAVSLHAYNEALVQQIASRRDSVAGVSLDEEMTSMIKFQHAYSAAAKLITLADEMLETLLSTKT